MQAFYDHHVENKPKTIKTYIAEAIILPGAYICGKLGAEAPDSFRIATKEELN